MEVRTSLWASGLNISVSITHFNASFPSRLCLTYLHLPEHIPERFNSRLHQLSVESTADWQRFGPRELKPFGVLLEEVQSLKRQVASEIFFFLRYTHTYMYV